MAVPDLVPVSKWAFAFPHTAFFSMGLQGTSPRLTLPPLPASTLPSGFILVPPVSLPGAFPALTRGGGWERWTKGAPRMPPDGSAGVSQVESWLSSSPSFSFFLCGMGTTASPTCEDQSRTEVRKSPCESQHAASVKPSIAFTMEWPWLELDPLLLPLASSSLSINFLPRFCLFLSFHFLPSSGLPPRFLVSPFTRGC